MVNEMCFLPRRTRLLTSRLVEDCGGSRSALPPGQDKWCDLLILEVIWHSSKNHQRARSKPTKGDLWCGRKVKEFRWIGEEKVFKIIDLKVYYTSFKNILSLSIFSTSKSEARKRLNRVIQLLDRIHFTSTARHNKETNVLLPAAKMKAKTVKLSSKTRRSDSFSLFCFRSKKN